MTHVYPIGNALIPRAEIIDHATPESSNEGFVTSDEVRGDIRDSRISSRQRSDSKSRNNRSRYPESSDERFVMLDRVDAPALFLFLQRPNRDLQFQSRLALGVIVSFLHA